MSLNHSEKLERLERILELTHEGWWEWDVEKNTTFHSPGWFKMLGLEPLQESSYKFWLEHVHPDDRAHTHQQQQTLIRQDKPWEIEFRMKHAQGHYIWILSRAHVLEKTNEGKPKLVGGVHIDITHQKRIARLNEELKFREELIQGIMNVSHSSITMVDLMTRRMSFTNGILARKMGYRDEEIQALSENYYESVIHPDDKGKLQNHLNKLMESKQGQMLECTLRFRAKDENYYSVLLRDSVFTRDDNGRPQEIIFSAIDVTRYLKLKNQLEENIKFIKEISFKNSHEMRAPVATLLGLVSLIKIEMPTQATALELVDFLEKTVLKMDDVIRELTNYLNDRLTKNE